MREPPVFPQGGPQPLLRWAGSKRKLMPRLREYWRPEYARYIEPFVGSGSLFFAIDPKVAILGDLNEELIDCLTTVQSQPSAVYDLMIALPLGKESYYGIRETNASSLSAVERAARFLFLNRFCFNGLYRTNRVGCFNVPYARSKTGDFPSKTQFVLSAQRLRNASLHCRDFEDLVRDHAAPGDFVYFDPPYAVSSRRVFKEYNRNLFSTDDLGRLVDLLHDLDRIQVAWVVSYAYCTEAITAFRKWPRKKVFAQRNIAGFAKHRRKAAELFISNT